MDFVKAAVLLPAPIIAWSLPANSENSIFFSFRTEAYQSLPTDTELYRVYFL